MATYTKINDFVEDALNGVHDLSNDTLTLALSNTAPGSESSNPTSDGNGVVANVTQISYTNLSGGASSLDLTGVSVSLSSGTVTLSANDMTLTASGGSLPTFRYVYLYNNTPTSPADPLIGLWDQGSTIDLADGESVTVDFGADGGSTGDILTLA